MDVFVDKTKCVGCEHCKNVCPVAVFEMYDKNSVEINNDSAPEDMKWKIINNTDVVKEENTVDKNNKQLKKKKSVAINGLSCTLCKACLIGCVGACIHIKDNTGTTYQSIHK